MMRKLFVAMLVGAVAVGLAAPAFAADLKFTGAYRVRFMFNENHPCLVETTDCTGNVFQTRFKPTFAVETEGGVRGVLQFEIGDIQFGNTAANTTAFPGSAGGGPGADGVNVETAAAYIDFPMPGTPLRLRGGIQHLLLSKALILDEDVSGLSLYGKLGEVNANAFWYRSASDVAPTAGADGNNARDVYGLDLAFSPTKDLGLNVYFAYEHNGAATTTALIGTWIGVGARGTVQNVRWDADFVHGSQELSATADQQGWVFIGSVGMPLAGTPLDLELKGWYATGDGDSGADSDAFPTLNGPGPDTGAQIWSGAPAIDINDLANNLQNSWALGLIARYQVNPNLRLTGNLHYIGTVEEGTAAFQPTVGGTSNLFGVDSVGTEVGVRVDYTLARGLVFTFTASTLLLGDDQSAGGTQFEDPVKVAGVVNYGF